MGKKQVNDDRKNYDIADQKQGRENLDDRQMDRALNDLREDARHDENPPEHDPDDLASTDGLSSDN